VTVWPQRRGRPLLMVMAVAWRTPGLTSLAHIWRSLQAAGRTPECLPTPLLYVTYTYLPTQPQRSTARMWWIPQADSLCNPHGQYATSSDRPKAQGCDVVWGEAPSWFGEKKQ